MDRRQFLKHTGLAAGLGLPAGKALAAGQAVTLAINAAAATPAVEWALGELRKRVTLRDEGGFRVWIDRVPTGPAESFSLRPANNGLDVQAPDERGLVYA